MNTDRELLELEPVAWEVSSYGGRVENIVVREDVAIEYFNTRVLSGAEDVRIRPLYAAQGSAQAALTKEFETIIDCVERDVGYGRAAWDMVDPKDLIKSIVKHAAPVSGTKISVDVSTCDEDATNRVFATLTGETASDGKTLIAIEDSHCLDVDCEVEYIRADLVKPMCVCGNPSDHEKYVHRVDGPCYVRAVDEQDLAHTDHPIRRGVRTSPPIWEQELDILHLAESYGIRAAPLLIGSSHFAKCETQRIIEFARALTGNDDKPYASITRTSSEWKGDDE